MYNRNMMDPRKSCKKSNIAKLHIEEEAKAYNAYQDNFSEHDKQRNAVIIGVLICRKFKKILKGIKTNTELGKSFEDTVNDDRNSFDNVLSNEMQGKSLKYLKYCKNHRS